MDPKPAKYAPKSDADIIDIVTRYPFAWIVSAADGFGATQLPIRPYIEDGKLTGLIGHFGATTRRSNACAPIPARFCC